jgi:hypothetical protein
MLPFSILISEVFDIDLVNVNYAVSTLFMYVFLKKINVS